MRRHEEIRTRRTIQNPYEDVWESVRRGRRFKIRTKTCGNPYDEEKSGLGKRRGLVFSDRREEGNREKIFDEQQTFEPEAVKKLLFFFTFLK